MKSRVELWVVVFGLMFSQGAWGDVLEIRGRGYVNGKVISEEGGMVTLQSAGGKVETIRRSDILFREEDLPAREVPKKSNWDFFKKYNAGDWLWMARNKFDQFVEGIKRRYPEVLKKFEDMGKPVNRSGSSGQGSVYADSVRKTHAVSKSPKKRLKKE